MNNIFSKKIAIVCAALAVAGAVIAPVSAFADDSTHSQQGGVLSTNATIDGSIAATNIVIEHPLNVAYTLDPTKSGYDSFVSGALTVKNDTIVPVDVTIESIAADKTTGTGILNFTDISPITYSDAQWAALGLADSKSKIAIALNTDYTQGWLNQGARTQTYATDGTQEIGTLATGSSADFTVSAKHGMSFDGSYTSQHDVVFEFNLSNSANPAEGMLPG